MGKVSLESLQAFIACVDCGGFSKAAKKLNKSQATISILVANLEDELHINLFDRNGRSPTLTSKGEVVYSSARNVVLSHQELLNMTGELLDERESAITLILSEYVPVEQRERIKEQYLSKINGMKLTLLTAESHDAVEMLLRREADVVVIPALKSRMNYPIELTGRRTWFSSPLHVYCSKDHPLFLRNDISEHDIKVVRRIRVLNGTTVNRSPRDDIFTDSIFRAYGLCAQGFGWCELPEWMVKTQQQLGDDRVVKTSVRPSKKALEFDVLYRNEIKGSFINWFITAVTNAPTQSSLEV